MFDELFEMFDRDKRNRSNGARPGLLGRIFGGGQGRSFDDDDDDRRRYERRSDFDDDEFEGGRDRSRRRRDEDFGFDD